MTTKQCNHCQEVKSLTEFNKRQAKCKPCQYVVANNWLNNQPKNYRYNSKKKSHNKIKGIYGIFDGENGDCLYIGESGAINRRIERHKTNINNLNYAEKWYPAHLELYKNLSLHKSVFFEILDECEKNIANKLEQTYIKIYKPLYNIKNSDKF
jgi:excinuclease UvrABC nuclease subunit